MDTRVLEHIGLTHNESIVYLTLIKEGTSKSGEILKNSGLNSGKIYEILESLKKKTMPTTAKVIITERKSSMPTRLFFFLFPRFASLFNSASQK